MNKHEFGIIKRRESYHSWTYQPVCRCGWYGHHYGSEAEADAREEFVLHTEGEQVGLGNGVDDDWRDFSKADFTELARE